MRTSAIICHSGASAYSFDTVMELKSILEKKGYLAVIYDVLRQGQKLAVDSLEKEAPDLLVTFDLEGFEQRTQTGNLFYNLLSCKMIHFLFGNQIRYRDYLSGKLSLAMFFFCVGSNEKEVAGMKEKYCNIQYLKQIGRLSTAEIEDVVTEVEREAGWLKDEGPSTG